MCVVRGMAPYRRCLRVDLDDSLEPTLDWLVALGGPSKLMESYRKAVQVQLEQSRNSKDAAEVPVFDISGTLEAVLACLLDDEPSKRLSVDLTHAFETLSMLSQLGSVQFSTGDQVRIADVVYEYWSSPLPSVVCRSLVEQMLVRKQKDTSAFLVGMLRTSQQNFSIGNKRPLHILAQVFDYTTQEQLDEYFPDLWDKLVLALHEQTGALQAAKILAKLGLRISRLAERLSPIMLIETHSTRQAIFETLLPPLLISKSDLLGTLLDDLVPKQGSHSSTRLLSYLSLVRAGLATKAAIYLDLSQTERIIGHALVHSEPSIRFEALRLLLHLPVGMTPSQRIPLRHFALYRTFWKYSIGDTDSASVRTGLVGTWKEFIARCKLSSTAAARDAAKQAKLAQVRQDGAGELSKEAEEYVQTVRQFLEDWSAHAVEQLRAFKPYRCQMNALRYLEILLGDGIDPEYSLPAESITGKGGKTRKSAAPAWSINLSIVASGIFVFRLVACITSTYEDIKHSAYQLLLRCPVPEEIFEAAASSALQLIGGKRDAEIISGTLLLRLVTRKGSALRRYNTEKCFIDKTEKMSLTSGRSSMCVRELVPPNAETGQAVVSIEEMLAILEKQLADASGDFEHAAEHAPIHGCISAINQLLLEYPPASESLRVYRNLYESSLRLVEQVWEITRPFLCKDTEAFDVQAGEDESSMDQVVSSAAWRAMKEAGDLLSTVLILPVSSSVPIWSRDEVDVYGSLFGTWLLEIGHRGAFAHISNAYGRLCLTLVKSKGETAHLPSGWLENHLTEILDRDRPTQRRSAGLPYLLLGVLSGSLANSANVELAFTRLFYSLEKGSQSSNATKSHAINSLRVLFLDGKLTTAVKKYVEMAFVVAVEGFGAPDWHVRNASLLLYAALIQRNFGTRREHLSLHKRTSIVEFFKTYKALHPILLKELKDQYQSVSAEALGSVFSALLLLSLVQTPEDNEEARRVAEPFLPYVQACSASPVWKVREAAAAGLSGLVPAQQTWKRCSAVLASLRSDLLQNELHGRLLQCISLAKTASVEAPPTFWTSALESLRPYIRPCNTVTVRTASLDLALLSDGALAVSFAGEVLDLASEELAVRGIKRPGEDSWQRALAQTLLRIDSQAWLLPVLSSGISAQEQGLLYLEKRPPQDLADGPTIVRLQSLAKASEEDLGNAIRAITVLSRLPLACLAELNIQLLTDIYRNSSVPMFREGLLPLLSRSTGLRSDLPFQKTIFEEIKDLGESESASARMSACQALSFFSMHNFSLYAFGRLLLHFLQDEDLDIRHLASRIASTHYSESLDIQSTRAIGLVWDHCIQEASELDAETLLLEQLTLLAEKLEDADSQAGVLFAVEKFNVYTDPSVDIEGASRILTNHTAALRSSMVIAAVEDRYLKVSNKLEKLVALSPGEENKQNPLSPAWTNHAIQEARQILAVVALAFQE